MLFKENIQEETLIQLWPSVYIISHTAGTRAETPSESQTLFLCFMVSLNCAKVKQKEKASRKQRINVWIYAFLLGLLWATHEDTTGFEGELKRTPSASPTVPLCWVHVDHCKTTKSVSVYVCVLIWEPEGKQQLFNMAVPCVLPLIFNKDVLTPPGRE